MFACASVLVKELLWTDCRMNITKTLETIKDQTNLSQIVAVCLFQEENGETSAVFVLEDNETTRNMWNNSFKLLYKVTVGNNHLNTTMTIENKGNCLIN